MRVLSRFLVIFVVSWSAATGFAAAPQTNQPPAVTFQPVPTLAPGNTTVTLTANVVDDGLPMGSSLTFRWCKYIGPGPVVFDDANSAQTVAHFNQAGVYELRFEASDGDEVTMEQLFVTVLQTPGMPPVVTNILNSFQAPGLDPIYGDRFLTMIPNAFPFNTTGAAYYAQVDPLNQKTTFNDFKIANGFGTGPQPLVQAIADSQSGCCTAGVYGNAGDLGFGRRMVMNRNGGDIAYYVTNYQTVHEAIEEDPAGIILTVCMEYSATPGASTTARYVKYFMYDGAGNRITDVDFDGRGPKPVPLACAACHGGAYSTNGGIPADGNMGAYFMPFDLDQFDFACSPEHSREANEAPFREFNAAILQTDAPAAIKQLIEGWYGGFGLPSPTQNPKWVPPGWKTEPELYREVVAQSCRNCHLTRTSATLDFDESSDFAAEAAKINGSVVFGPTPAGFRMPHAEATWERFWLSTTPHQPALLRSAFDPAGNFVGLGPPPGRIFVDAAAVGVADGSTWTDAYTDLAAALAAAAAPGSTVTEIWVAAGTYRPDPTGLGNPRDATFQIPDGIEIYGGFVSGDTLLEQRDPRVNRTILDGDLNGDDGVVGKNDNSHHVVTMTSVGSAGVLDGFEIRGGNAVGAADPRGGGIYVLGGSPVIVRTTIVDNLASAAGGLLVDGAGLRMVGCAVLGNDGDVLAGGIMGTNGAQLALESSIIGSNVATGVDGDAGGILCDGGQLRIVNGTIHGNSATRAGGGILVRGGVAVDIDNSIFWNNDTSGVMAEDDQIMIDNATGVVTVELDHSLVEGLTGMLGGQANLASDPLFINPAGVDGMPGTIDDEYRVQDASPAVDAGDNGALPSDDLDLDEDFYLNEPSPVDAVGNVRRFESNRIVDTGQGDAPLVDLGAVEMINASLSDCGAGNVRLGVDGPHDVLTVNGSAGGPSRLVYLATGQNLVISMSLPPGQTFAPFTIFLSLGVPEPDDVFTLDFGIGQMCFTPSPLLPFANGDFVLTDNLGLGFPAAIGSLPLSAGMPTWSLPPFPIGDAEVDFTVQGLIWDVTKPLPISVTNGVVVSVRENPPVNFDPVAAVADPSLQAFTNANVVLDGSSSFDPEGLALTYAWMQTSGTPVTLNNDDQPVADFTAPGTPAMLEFQLTVSDGVNTSAPQLVTVQVESDTPIADAGPNQTVITEANVQLDGSGSADPQMTPLTYQWTQTSGPSVGLNGTPAAATVNPSFTAPASSAVLVFQLVVSDGVNFSVADSVTVTVQTSFVKDVYPIFSMNFVDCDGFPKNCTDCHTGMSPSGGLLFDQPAPGVYTALLAGRVDTMNPSNSLVLRKPLSTVAGGASHTGGNIWCSTADPNYVTILNWITEGAQNN